MKKEALELVEDLNNQIGDKGDLDHYLPFEFKSYGWNNSAIYFMGVILWAEENDEREYLKGSDEQESLKSYVIRESKRILKDINLKMKAI